MEIKPYLGRGDGFAALTVAPDDVGALAARLLSLVRDPALRATRRDAGLARAALFSYEKIAARTVELYERVNAGTA